MSVAQLRQTDLSISDLIKEIKEPTRDYPTCLIINEIGIACLCNEDGKDEGEKALLSLLEHDDQGHRFVTFCMVSLVPSLAQEKASILEAFRKNPDNQPFLEIADEKIREFKDQFGL